MSSKQSNFFFGSNQNKPKLNLFRFVSRNQTHFFSVCFGVSDRYRNNRNKQNLWYGETKRFIFEQFCCCFVWSFVCFGCFETPKLPVSILKGNNRNKRLVSDSAEISFGCFDTKQVSEDTLIQTSKSKSTDGIDGSTAGWSSQQEVWMLTVFHSEREKEWERKKDKKKERPQKQEMQKMHTDFSCYGYNSSPAGTQQLDGYGRIPLKPLLRIRRILCGFGFLCPKVKYCSCSFISGLHRWTLTPIFAMKDIGLNWHRNYRCRTEKDGVWNCVGYRTIICTDIRYPTSEYSCLLRIKIKTLGTSAHKNVPFLSKPVSMSALMSMSISIFHIRVREHLRVHATV